MTVKPFLAALAIMAGSSANLAAVPFTANFEADQSANFVTVISTDANSNFNYDSSTHVQEGGDPLTIPAAPGSATTKVLRMNANVTDGTSPLDAVNVYPTVTGLGSSWSMTYDVWQNYNGPAAGGSGSTQMHLFGATNANTVVAITSTAPSIAGDGFYFTMTGEGGAAADYRFYSGTGTIVANNAGATVLGGANYNNTAAPWLAFFPTPPFETTGAPGKAWITVRLTVNGTNATVAIKKSGEATFTDVATAVVPATATKPFVGFSDINAGISSTPAQVLSQFNLIDNMLIDNAPASVNEWTLY